MGLYHLSVKIIGRGSGRSAVGAAAYRSGQALRSAAYRSGGEMHDGEIVHDYTKKKGVVHSEIILPDGAPLEFADRQTLWNTVEANEMRRDARLAREIEVALQVEFELYEQITLLREFIKENFVDKGMISDFSIHSNEGNPHAHIMLTTRTVSPDGFGKKNPDWDKRENLLIWREKWAEINNRFFEEKGLAERIDHRTLMAQGINREPTIHMGAAATALERRGIRTERGDYNREITRINEARAANLNSPAEGAASGVRNQNLESTRTHAALNAAKQRMLIEQCEAAKMAQYIEKQEQIEAAQSAKSLEEQLKAEKAEQIAEKMREQRRTRELAALTFPELKPRMNAIENEFCEFERELRDLKTACIEIKRDIPPLEYRTETIDEYAQNIRVKQQKIELIRENRQNARWWEWEKKSCLDGRIRIAEIDLESTRKHFIRKFKIEPEQAPAEIERIQKIIRKKELEIAEKEARMRKIETRQDALQTEYHTLKLRRDAYRNKEQDKAHAQELADIIERQIQSAREKQIQEQIIHRLNTISKEDFQKALEKLSYEEAQALLEIQETAKEQGLIKERKRNRTRIIGRSR